MTAKGGRRCAFQPYELALLQDRHAILTVQPFDLFPHTAHIECLVHLEKRNSAMV